MARTATGCPEVSGLCGAGREPGPRAVRSEAVERQNLTIEIVNLLLDGLTRLEQRKIDGR